jgi:thioredoxin reductase (NADPH)
MIYDVAIIGSGPAGLTAAIYTSRAKLKTVVLEKMVVGGQVTTTYEVENYPGFTEPINGFLLMNKFENQAKKFGTEIITGSEVTNVSRENDFFNIETSKGLIKSKTIIIATGAKYRKIGIPGEDKFTGRGVSYCATCDGAFFKDRVVAVIGGGNSALEESLFLTKFVKKVYLIHRRKEFRADKVIQEKVFENDKIEPVLNYIPVEIKGDNDIKEIVIKEKETGEIKSLNVDGVFIFIGLTPNSENFKDFVKMDENGYIIVNKNLETNLPGVFAAGDVIQKDLRQIATAVGDGAIAANSAKNYIENQ